MNDVEKEAVCKQDKNQLYRSNITLDGGYTLFFSID